MKPAAGSKNWGKNKALQTHLKAGASLLIPLATYSHELISLELVPTVPGIEFVDFSRGSVTISFI